MPAAPPIVQAGIALGVGLYGQKQQQKAQEKAQRRAVEQQNERRGLEIAAAQRAHQARMAAIAAQSQIANQGSQTFNRDVTEQLGNIKQDISSSENQRRQNLGQVIRRDVAGEAGQARQVGSEVKGRVSESFGERGQAAGARNLGRANEQADRMALLGAFRDLPVKRGQQINQIGINQLPFGRERASQAAIDRLRIQRASLIPQEGTEFIDPTSPLGDALAGIGEGLLFNATRAEFGGGGPFTTSGGGGTGVNPSTVQTFTRGR